MSTGEPTLEAVLEAFLLDAHEEGALATYLRRHPGFSLELIDLAHHARRVEPDAPRAIDQAAQAAVDALTAQVLAAWPVTAERRNLFAELRPSDYGRISTTMGVPRGVIGAVKDGLAIWSSIPSGWLKRLAEALRGSIDELHDSIRQQTAHASFKADARPEQGEPVEFEQLLIEARVDDERRAEIMAERD